jgi:hypothetical protein
VGLNATDACALSAAGLFVPVARTGEAAAAVAGVADADGAMGLGAEGVVVPFASGSITLAA